MTASSAASLGRAATHAAAEVLDQDEHSADWRTQRKHFFVLSNAGACLLIAEMRCLQCIFLIQSTVWSEESMQLCRQHSKPAKGPLTSMPLKDVTTFADTEVPVFLLLYLSFMCMLCLIYPTHQGGHACLQAGLSSRRMAASMPWLASWPSLMR